MIEISIEPLVSVCVPVYNHENYVVECIQSIINQDYQNIELIIIDDGSKDNSIQKIEEIISACKKRFFRFEFRCRANKGLCETLNEAIGWCEGDLFSAVASDDIWLREKISRQIRVFRKIDVDVVAISAELQKIDRYGKILGYINRPAHNGQYYDFDDVLYGRSRMCAPTAMIKMGALRETGGYDNTTVLEDLYMWLTLTSRGYRIYLSPEVLASYRDHGNNTHQKIRLMHQHSQILIEKFSPDIEAKNMALRLNLERYFIAGALYDKSYGIKIFLSGKVRFFRKSVFLAIILLFIPRSFFPRVQVLGRMMKKSFGIK